MAVRFIETYDAWKTHDFDRTPAHSAKRHHGQHACGDASVEARNDTDRACMPPAGIQRGGFTSAITFCLNEGLPAWHVRSYSVYLETRGGVQP
jgi:hypothetical protein